MINIIHADHQRAKTRHKAGRGGDDHANCYVKQINPQTITGHMPRFVQDLNDREKLYCPKIQGEYRQEYGENGGILTSFTHNQGG